MNIIKLRYRYDGTPIVTYDDFGWLEIQVLAESYSGVGGYWVQWQDVVDFNESLTAYPIDENDPPSGDWGFVKHNVYHRLMWIEISHADKLDEPQVSVELSTKEKPLNRLRASFPISYQNLQSFQSELRLLMDRKINEACLYGI